MGFRYDIQGLRALAVLLVFIFHLNSSWLIGGFVGVDIFFVISGFLVSSIILHKKEKGTFGFVDFYIGRIKRIVPVFVIMLLIVLIVGSFIYMPIDIKPLRLGVFQASIFNSNNYLASLDNYFGASSQENPILHTWTLSIEMQFYFLLPLFLMFFKKKYIVPMSLFIIVLLFGYSFYNSTFLNNQSGMYFSLAARIPEFLIGTVFAIKAKDIKALIGNRQNVLSILSLVGIVLCGIFYTEHFNFPGLWVILPCVFAGILLVTTESKVNTVFSNKLLVHIGELSYSIYLWHWVIMAFIRYYYVRAEFTWYEILGIVILTYVLSWLSYTYIENLFRKDFGIVKGVISISVIVFFCLFAFNISRINESNIEIPKEYGMPFFGINSHGGSFKKIEKFGTSNMKDNNLKICLIGDSHAFSYLGFFNEAGKDYDFQLSSISNSTYPLISKLDISDFNDIKLFDNYIVLQEKADSLINKSDIIFVAFSWENNLKSLDSAIETFVEKNRHNKKIVFVQDYPTLNVNALRINRDYLKINKNSNVKVLEVNVPAIINKLVLKYDNVSLLKLDYGLLIDRLPYNNDTIMYYDKGHLNYYGSSVLNRFFGKELKNVISSR